MRTMSPALAALLGRLLLSAIFLLSAAAMLMDWSHTTDYMAAKGMVATPFFLACAIGLEIFGGLSVLLGLFTRFGAAALILFLIVATPIFHDFWAQEGMARVDQMQHFMKNTAIVGGALILAGLGPGRYSLDRWRRGERETSASEPTSHESTVVV